MMTNRLNLDGNVIDADQVSFVGKVDKTINHGTAHASILYWFVIVVGGRDVKISNQNETKLNEMRDKLLLEL